MADKDTLDPVLADAARKLAEGRTKYEQDHPGLSMPRKTEEAWMRDQTNGKYGVGDADALYKKFITTNDVANMTRMGLQGATLGFADELAGIGKPGETARIRLANTLYGQANPGPAFLAQMGGGLALPGLGAASTLAKELGIVGKMALGAGLGSGITAGNIAGQAEGGLAERAQAVAQHPGAVAGGALLGGAIPGLQGAAAKMDQVVGAWNPFQRAANTMNKTLLPQVSEMGAPAGPAAQGPGAVMANVGRYGTSDVTTASPTMYEAMGEPGTVGMKSAIQGNPALRAPAAVSAARQALRPDQPGFAANLVTGINAKLKAWSDPLYAKMAADHPEVASKAMRSATSYDEPWAELVKGEAGTPKPGIDEVLSMPTVRRALDRAQKDANLGVVPDVGPYSFQNVRDAMALLQEQADNAFKNDNHTLGKALKDAKGVLDEELQAQVPEYARVQRTYGAWKQKATEAAAEGGKLDLPTPAGAPKPPVTGIGSAMYRVAMPIIKNTVGIAHRNTATELSKMLNTSGPEDIQALLAELAKRGQAAPQTLPVRPLAAIAELLGGGQQ